jgi:hypothetical protein
MNDQGDNVTRIGPARAEKANSCMEWSVLDALLDAAGEEQKYELTDKASIACVVLVCRDNGNGSWNMEATYGGPGSTRDRLYAMISQKATWMAVDNRSGSE